MEAGNESVGFSQCVLPASHMDGPCSVLGGSHVEREGNSPAGHIPACKKYCLQSCLGLMECWQEKGFIPEKVGLSLRACIPTWKLCVELQGSLSASHCAEAELPKSRPLGVVGVQNAVGQVMTLL